MPFIARYNGEKKAPVQVPKGEEATCLACGETVTVRGPFEDGRARHFWHSQRAAGGSSGPGGGDCDSVAESDKHMKWKSFAADRILQIFEENARNCRMEMELEAPASQKDYRRADSILLFDDRDEQLGQGVVIEVQHKNESKDIAATTRDYIKQDLSVVWADESDFFDDRCKLEEIDIRHRAQEAARKHVLPDHLNFTPDIGRLDALQTYRKLNRERFHLVRNHTIPGYEPPAEIPATLPNEYIDDLAQDCWKSRDWESLFDPPTDYTDIWAYAKVPATLPQKYVRGVALEEYRSIDWFSLFPDVMELDSGPLIDYPEQEYRIKLMTDLTHDRTGEVPFNKWICDAETPPQWLRDAYLSGINDIDEVSGVCPHCSAWQKRSYFGESLLSTTCRDCGDQFVIYPEVRACLS